MVSGLAGADILVFAFAFVISATVVGWYLTGNPFVGIFGFALAISGAIAVAIVRQLLD